MNASEQKASLQNPKDIFERMRSGEPIRMNDPEYSKIFEVINRTIKLNAKLNVAEDVRQARKRLSEIIGSDIDYSFNGINFDFGTNRNLGIINKDP